MGFPLSLVSTVKRLEWIEERFDLERVIYMGDGIFDHLVMSRVHYSIAPANADDQAKKCASFVTARRGGDRAVAEACLHLLNRFFSKNIDSALTGGEPLGAGEWGV
jgi:3-deoxy-D-manno-octulosonate 8-phosphate phosphatase (KDO 8-P phosphatase)